MSGDAGRPRNILTFVFCAQVSTKFAQASKEIFVFNPP